MSSGGAGFAGVAPHAQRNFVLNVLDGAIFAFGMSLASRTTVLPLFVQKLGGSYIAIGLIPVLWAIGFNLPQLMIANYARQAPSKKRLVLQTGLFQRVPWLALAIITLVLIWRLPPGWGLASFFILYGLAAFGGSLNLPGWFDLVAKLTPVRMRGRLFAWRAVLGGLLGMVAGVVVTQVLGEVANFGDFALLFALAFAATMISYLLLVALREEVPTRPPRRVRYKAFLRKLPRILRRDRAYRNFVIGDALVITALMSEAFFAIYAIERFGLAAGYVGVFIMVLTASAAAGSLLFGYIADRVGHRINLALGAGATMLACLAALFAPTPGVFLVVFVGSSFALGLPMISRLPIIAELCAEEDRPTYVALTNALTAPFWLSGLVAGFIADRFGFDILFGVTAMVAFVAMAWMLTMVPEPRNAAVAERLPPDGPSSSQP